MNKIISFEDYKNLKLKDVLNPEEQQRITYFDNYLEDSKKYQPFLSERALCVSQKIKEELNPSLLDDKSVDLGLARKLKQDDSSMRHAGYINASILIYAILNIGVIAAIVMILFKN